jgi:hypothetical protein
VEVFVAKKRVKVFILAEREEEFLVWTEEVSSKV